MLHTSINIIMYIYKTIKYITNISISLNNSISKLNKASKSLKRLPIHLGIVLVEDNFSFVDLANIILWSSAMDITCISLYDNSGIYTCLYLFKLSNKLISVYIKFIIMY